MKNQWFMERTAFHAFGLAVLCILLSAAMPGSAQIDDQGAAIFSGNCAVCHGADGKGSDRGPAIATEPSVIGMSDTDLLNVLHNGAAGGMPAFPQFSSQQAQSVVKYLRQLQGVIGAAPTGSQPVGDASAGKAVFFGKGGCSQCHMIDGQGGFLAPDLTSYGHSRDAATILQAIVEPDSHPQPGWRGAEVQTQSGEKISGLVRTEDNLQIVLQSKDGRFHFFERSDLAAIHYIAASLMPADYATRLSAKELDDLVGYLVVIGKNTTPEPTPTRGRRLGHE
jgi:cytochrome c oxidase cbb3-type subunit III